MQIGVCYAHAEQQVWMRLEVPDNSRVEEAIRHSGILKRFPEIDLSKQKVGIFGKLVKLDSEVKEGDRIEIYRPITADLKTVKRRKLSDDDDDDDDDD
jgi:putative ubiquitin-RnfH superfamily antitoxin RatB of RatAB toxin-antitoxin module